MGFASDDKVQLEMEPFHSTGAADQDLLNRLNVFRNKQVRPLAVDLRIVVILLAILLAKLLCFQGWRKSQKFEKTRKNPVLLKNPGFSLGFFKSGFFSKFVFAKSYYFPPLNV